MPSSLVVVALVVAWLVVLVPMIVRKRQEVAKTGDSELGARVLRSGNGEADTGAELEAEPDTFDTEEAAVHEAELLVATTAARAHSRTPPASFVGWFIDAIAASAPVEPGAGRNCSVAPPMATATGRRARQPWPVATFSLPTVTSPPTASTRTSPPSMRRTA